MSTSSKHITGHEKIFNDILGEITDGQLILRNPDGYEYIFGSGKPSACIYVHDKNLYSKVLANASIGFGEGYMDGMWDAKDDRITDVIGILMLNELDTRVRGNPALALRCLCRRALHKPISPIRSKKNVEHHYDLGNDFYKLFLDSTMTYSCGYMKKDDDTLEIMQNQKYDLISRKLYLSSGDTVIDIGCGWGGMLIYAAKKYGISGVGITLSKEQKEYAVNKIKKEGLSDRLEIRLQDYRELKGDFDKFVSIGMFEHVGKTNYHTFMKKVNDILKPGGLGLLHTIGTSDVIHGGFDQWMDKYIFPGGRLPRLHEIVIEMNRSGLRVGHIENLKLHYAVTLRHWKNNFDKNKKKIQSLDSRFNERFIRMWNYYLQSCEAGFRYGNLQLYQILFCKGPRWVLPKNYNFL